MNSKEKKAASECLMIAGDLVTPNELDGFNEDNGEDLAKEVLANLVDVLLMNLFGEEHELTKDDYDNAIELMGCVWNGFVSRLIQKKEALP